MNIVRLFRVLAPLVFLVIALPGFIVAQDLGDIEGNLTIKDTLQIESLGDGMSTRSIAVDEDGKLIVQPRESKVLVLGPSSFQAFRPYWNHFNGGIFIFADSTSIDSTVSFHAPVHLPDGATVDSITFHFLDNSNAHLTCTFGYTVWSDETAIGFGQISTAPEPMLDEYRSLTRTIDVQIDNSDRYYYVRVFAQSHWDSIRLKFKGVQIWYTQ